MNSFEETHPPPDQVVQLIDDSDKEDGENQNKKSRNRKTALIPATRRRSARNHTAQISTGNLLANQLNEDEDLELLVSYDDNKYTSGLSVLKILMQDGNFGEKCRPIFTGEFDTMTREELFNLLKQTHNINLVQWLRENEEKDKESKIEQSSKPDPVNLVADAPKSDHHINRSEVSSFSSCSIDSNNEVQVNPSRSKKRRKCNDSKSDDYDDEDEDEEEEDDVEENKNEHEEPIANKNVNNTSCERVRKQSINDSKENNSKDSKESINVGKENTKENINDCKVRQAFVVIKAKHFGLVRSDFLNINEQWEDGMWILGVFSSEKKAKQFCQEKKKTLKRSITTKGDGEDENGVDVDIFYMKSDFFF